MRFDGHPNIIRYRDYFEANGTVHLVMDFENGLPLDTFLARREAQGEPLTEADGVWYDQETAMRKAKKCHDADIEIVGIGFGSVDKGFIQSISSASDLSVLTS